MTDSTDTQAPRIHLVTIAQAGDGKRFSFPLAAGQVRIGRALENDIVLGEQTVSRVHARVALGAEGCTLEDLGSRTGVLVNGEAVSAPRPLQVGDMIRIGTTLLRFESELPQVKPREAAPVAAVLSISEPGGAARRQELRNGQHSIGRDPKCDVILGGQQVAPFQAMLTLEPGGWKIAPLAGAEAVLLNGAPLAGVSPLTERDILRIGPYALQLAPQQVAAAPPAADSAGRVELMQTMIQSAPVLQSPGEGYALVCLSGGSRGMRYPLPRPLSVIGSAVDSAVRIMSAPPQAVRLSRAGDAFDLVKVDAGVAVRVSGGRKPPCAIAKGDLIDVGGTVLRLISSDEAFTAKFDESDFDGAAAAATRSRLPWILGGVMVLLLAVGAFLLFG